MYISQFFYTKNKFSDYVCEIQLYICSKTRCTSCWSSCWWAWLPGCTSRGERRRPNWPESHDSRPRLGTSLVYSQELAAELARSWLVKQLYTDDISVDDCSRSLKHRKVCCLAMENQPFCHSMCITLLKIQNEKCVQFGNP